MKKILLILIILPFCTFAQVDTTQITLKPNWFETNVIQGLEIYFAGTYGRPNDFSDQSLLDDYGFTIGFKNWSWEQMSL